MSIRDSTGEEMAEKNNRALGKGIGALFKKEPKEEPKNELVTENGNFEFYGSLMKKYIQSGSSDPMIAQMLEEIREHLGISPEEHLHMMNTLRKREEARQVWADKNEWEKEHGGLQNELKDMFRSYTSGSGESANALRSAPDVIEGPGAIALMERNPTVISEDRSSVISVPPHTDKPLEKLIDNSRKDPDAMMKGEVPRDVSMEELPELDEVMEEDEEEIKGEYEPPVIVQDPSGPSIEEKEVSRKKYPKETLLDLKSLMEYGEMDAAMAMVQRLLEDDPYSPTLLNEKGVLFYNMDRMEDASECYRRALSLEPDSPEININFALVLSGMGETDASIRHLDKAIEKDPYNEEAWNNKAVILTQTGRLRDALNCLDESLRINETSPTAWHNTAVILERMGDYPAALECYLRVVDLDPKNGAAAAGLDYCRSRTGISR